MPKRASKKSAPKQVTTGSGRITGGLKADTLETENFSQVLADCFARYAKMVLTDRAIPDVRDGLKPGQRRIIFDMWKQGITFDRKTVKCAKTVGDVLGNYHPHGDSSVYDAMVRLSQDWKMEVPLLTFQGNNGSIDNDPAAAYRYTEAKLAQASDLMTRDLDEETVDMMLTFDDQKTEPVVLPAGFPNLLINGAQGIAVGNATNIPTHNPSEIIEACLLRLSNPECTLEDLMGIVQGPDFPTGGLIDDKEAIRKLYATGKASFYIHSKAYADKEKSCVVITQIPYGVVKSQLVAELDEKRIKYKLDNITEVRDESGEDIRIVLDIRRGADPQEVLDYLTSKGLLRTTFAANMLVLDKGHPRTLGLLPIIDSYLAHREEVVTRRSKFELNRAKNRQEIVQGLLKASSIIDEVIAIIRHADSRAAAKSGLMTRFGFTAVQADAIGNMRLYSLTKLDIKALTDEGNELAATIARLNDILSSKSKLNQVIASELKEAKELLNTPRRTEILDTQMAVKAVDQKSLIAAEDVRVVISADGYIKRTNMRSYQSSTNPSESPALNLPALKVGDRLVLERTCSTHDDILGFTSAGNYFVLPVWQIPEGRWKEEGKHISTLVSLGPSEKIVTAFAIKAKPNGLNIILLSRSGRIKRACLDEINLSKLTTRPLRAMALVGDDSIVDAKLASGDSSVIVWAQDGCVNRFDESDIPMVGLKAAGVKAMNAPANTKEPFEMARLTILPGGEESRLLVVCDNRRVTLIASDPIPEEKRLGRKTQAVSIPKASHPRLVDIIPVSKTKGHYPSILLALDSGSMELDINGMDTSIVGVLLRKENVATQPANATIVGVHQTGVQIDMTTPVHEAPKVAPAPVKATSDGSPKQMTFFDILENDLKDSSK